MTITYITTYAINKIKLIPYKIGIFFNILVIATYTYNAHNSRF